MQVRLPVKFQDELNCSLFVKKYFMFLHILFLLYKESNKSNFVYVLVYRNILMYDILACH